MHRVSSNVTLEGNDVIWINPQLSSTGENEFVVPLHVAIVNTNGKLPAIDPLRFIYLFIYLQANFLAVHTALSFIFFFFLVVYSGGGTVLVQCLLRSGSQLYCNPHNSHSKYTTS